MRKLVGYGFSLPSKSSLFNIGNFDLLGFLFVGRLKPYPTKFHAKIAQQSKTLQFETYFSQKIFF